MHFLESCCDELTLETWGMADFYQGERLGKYSKVGTSSDGRSVFKQNDGDNYLFYLSQNGVSFFNGHVHKLKHKVSTVLDGGTRNWS